MTKSTAVAVPETSAYAVLAKAANAAERYAAGQYVTETVQDPETGKPMPRFIYDMPWAADGSDAATEILARLAGSDDLEAATDEQKLRKVRDLIDQPVVIEGALARASDYDESNWKCYLALTVSVKGGPPELVHCGAPQVMVIVWRSYMEGKLPLRGQFMEVGKAKAGQDRALSFRIESEL